MYGLVLEGGGAKGSYHIGAFKAIREEGLEIKAVAGTSIGALNGAMIVQNDFERCNELWEDISYSMIIDGNDEEIERLINLKLGKEDLIPLAHKLKTLLSDGGFDITPFKNLLDEYIDEDKIRNSNIDFGLVTVDLTNFKPIETFISDIPKGELKNYLLASAYLPVFKKEKLGGIRFLDGGFYNNLPFDLLKSKGYNNLILVRTHARGVTRRYNVEELNAIVISPSDDIGHSYDFDKENAKRNIELGYFDGLKAIRGLKGFRYYIESEREESHYLECLMNIKDSQIEKIRANIKTPKIPNKRTFFEYIIPKLASGMGLERQFSYEDFFIKLIEKRAEASGIDRFKIYNIDELLNLTKITPVLKEEEHDSTKLEKIIESIDISSLFNKEETILNVAGIILFDE